MNASPKLAAAIAALAGLGALDATAGKTGPSSINDVPCLPELPRAVSAAASPSPLKSGVVRCWDSHTGQGYITPDEGGSSVFAHSSAIDMGGYKSLNDGMLVGYEVASGPKGVSASKVRLFNGTRPVWKDPHSNTDACRRSVGTAYPKLFGSLAAMNARINTPQDDARKWAVAVDKFRKTMLELGSPTLTVARCEQAVKELAPAAADIARISKTGY